MSKIEGIQDIWEKKTNGIWHKSFTFAMELMGYGIFWLNVNGMWDT